MSGFPINYPNMIIDRSHGENDSERYLMKMCDKSFLRLWTWRNLYYIDGNIKKEICDVLVVFRNKIIIFSDKYIEFGKCEKTDFKRIDVLWKRWYKKAVSNSVDQIYGAERNLKTNPENIYLDKECEKKFPVSISFNVNTKIYRVAVAHGARDACKDLFNGGSGSLILTNDVDTVGSPFSINYEAFGKGFVHVLDDVTLDIILNRLDTITDFTDYLDEKEKLLKNIILHCCGEEDLLAQYLFDFDKKKNKHVLRTYDGIQGLFVEEGNYFDVVNSEEFKLKEKADEVSYLWDKVIDNFVEHAISGTSSHTNADNLNDQSTMLSFLAAEKRFKRRLLAKCLVGLIEKYHNFGGARIKASRAVDKPDENGLLYFFLILSTRNFKSDENYRKARRKMLEDHAFIYKYVNPEALHIIGLATEVENYRGRSKDLIYLDCSNWNGDMQLDAKNTHDRYAELNLFGNNQQYVKTHEVEYPTVEKERNKSKKEAKFGRNDPCPCGSGNKYKKCCLNK